MSKKSYYWALSKYIKYLRINASRNVQKFSEKNLQNFTKWHLKRYEYIDFEIFHNEEKKDSKKICSSPNRPLQGQDVLLGQHHLYLKYNQNQNPVGFPTSNKVIDSGDDYPWLLKSFGKSLTGTGYLQGAKSSPHSLSAVCK